MRIRKLNGFHTQKQNSMNCISSKSFVGIIGIEPVVSFDFQPLTQANFEANSDFFQLTQNFRSFKQKPSKYGLTGPKSWPNPDIFLSNLAKIFL